MTATRKAKAITADNTSTFTKATPASSTASSPRTANVALLGTVATITDAEIQVLESACTTFALALGTSGKMLSKGDISRLPKARKNAQSFVNAVVLAGNKYNISSPSYPTSDIQANQQLVTKLVGAIDAVETLLKMLKDTSLLAQSSAWTGALVVYRMLAAEAPSNLAIATSLVPLREAFRVKLVTPAGTKTVKRARSANAIAKAAKAAPGAKPSGATGTATTATGANTSPAAPAPVPVGHS